jgi:hypothetical protein
VLLRINNVSQCTQIVRTFKQQYPVSVLQVGAGLWRVARGSVLLVLPMTVVDASAFVHAHRPLNWLCACHAAIR